jgi:hypothetical protein
MVLVAGRSSVYWGWILITRKILLAAAFSGESAMGKEPDKKTPVSIIQ